MIYYNLGNSITTADNVPFFFVPRWLKPFQKGTDSSKWKIASMRADSLNNEFCCQGGEQGIEELVFLKVYLFAAMRETFAKVYFCDVSKKQSKH